MFGQPQRAQSPINKELVVIERPSLGRVSFKSGQAAEELNSHQPHDELKQLRSNLHSLEALASKMQFMLFEITYLVSR